jgi:hypothetical protein
MEQNLHAPERHRVPLLATWPTELYGSAPRGAVHLLVGRIVWNEKMVCDATEVASWA